MSAVVIHLHDPTRLHAGITAVRNRAAALNASAESLRHALQVLFREMQSGRSTAASVALANSSMRPVRYWSNDGGAA